ncbi:DUF3501 family protein [Myxococcota bacterium]|nr:DUF3501 family protein [Myxococcota bacterium]
MSPLTRADILPVDRFQQVRQQHLAEVLAHQAVRRVPLGPNMTLLFENRTTMRWQIHEMCRVEGLHGDKVDHELATYNALLPGPDELSATLLVEYEDAAERDGALRRLVGLDRHLWLALGDRRLPARFDREQFNEERISSVQFVRLPLDPAARAALADLSQPARLVVDHAAYRATTDLSRATRGALLDDLDEAARA